MHCHFVDQMSIVKGTIEPDMKRVNIGNLIWDTSHTTLSKQYGTFLFDSYRESSRITERFSLLRPDDKSDPLLYVLGLVVSGQRSAGFYLTDYGLIEDWTSLTSPEHIRQADLSMLPRRMVTARVLVVLVVLLRSKLRRDRHYQDSPIHGGYTVPDVESQVFTADCQCLTYFSLML